MSEQAAAKGENWQPRGVLNFAGGQQKFVLTRRLPAPDLAAFVEYYWLITWDLRGQEPYLQETLPHPHIHLVFERGNTKLFGVPTGKFSYLLREKGGVVGMRFRPGGFYAFLQRPLAEITGTTLTLEQLWGVDSATWEDRILRFEEQDRAVAEVENFLRERLPAPVADENIAAVGQLIDLVSSDRTILQVEDLVSKVGLGKRQLQRLFNQYVGVSPKWVIKRYRLHEVVAQLAPGQSPDWSRLLHDLGYFDQAHFIKDFKMFVGQTPSEYVRKL